MKEYHGDGVCVRPRDASAGRCVSNCCKDKNASTPMPCSLALMPAQPERLTLLLLLQVTCLTFSASRGCFTEPANTCTLRPADTAPSPVTHANHKTSLRGVRFCIINYYYHAPGDYSGTLAGKRLSSFTQIKFIIL